MDDEPRLAVFIDFENLALGVRQSKKGNRFEIELVLKRLGAAIAKPISATTRPASVTSRGLVSSSHFT